MSKYLRGKIDCAQQCVIPEGKALTRVPCPRHAWPDIIRCPDCGDCFLIVPQANADAESDTLKADDGSGNAQ